MGGREGLARTEVGSTVVALPAELSAASALSVGEELDTVLAAGITTVIVDLTATTSCDSSGVAVLALARGKAVAHNAELRLVAPSAAVRHVLALAGLDRVLRIYPSMDEALTAAPDQMAREAVERLTEMDRIYQKWITAVSESSGRSPVLLVPDPDRAAPGMFRLFSTGPALVRFAEGLNGFCSSRPEGLSGEHADLISNFFGILQGWIANSGDQSSVQAEPDVSWALDRQMNELAKDGFAVGARERFLLLTGGMDAKPLPWRIVDIKVLPAVPV